MGRWGEGKFVGRCLLLSVSDSGSPVAEALEATEGRFVTEAIIKKHAVGGHLTSDSLVLQRTLRWLSGAEAKLSAIRKQF